MASGLSGAVVGQVDRLFGQGTVTGLDEGQLLERFVTRRDEAAFEALVSRHGPMVQGLCRRILRDRHDAEDAFQATFLLLARKAGAIRSRDLVGPWLYRVAHRVAVKASQEATRRKARERPDPDAAEHAPDPSGPPAEPDLAPAIHAELAQLPETYRAPVVLCDLQGLSHEEAAARLRWPVGTVKGRLSRARDRLRDRLARRGIAAPAALVAAVLAGEAKAAVPVPLLDSTVKAAVAAAAGRLAVGLASSPAALLAGGVARAMMLKKVQSAATAALLAAGVLAATGFGLAAARPGDGDAPGQAARRSDPIADDLNRMQGVWWRVASEAGGEDAMKGRDRNDPGLLLTIDGNIFNFSGRDHVVQLDPSRSPKEITLVSMVEDRPEAFHGLYKLEGDRLTFCLALGGGRPDDFATKENDGRRLDTYERVEAASEPAGPTAGAEAVSGAGGDAEAAGLPTASPIRDEQRADRLTKLDLLRLDAHLLEGDLESMKRAIDGVSEEIHEIDPADAERLGTPVGILDRFEVDGNPLERRMQVDRLVEKLDALKSEYAKRTADLHRMELEIARTSAELGGAGTRPGLSDDERAMATMKLDAAKLDEELLADDVADLKSAILTAGMQARALRQALAFPAPDGTMASPNGFGNATREELQERLKAVESQMEAMKDEYHRRDLELQDLRARVASLEGAVDAPAAEPRKIRPGDLLVIEVLEALPGRPLTGERVVRPDGTISLGFYGDLPVAGLDRTQIKVKLVEHMQKYLTDEVLGLVGEDEDGRTIAVPPHESDRVFVDESPTLLGGRQDTRSAGGREGSDDRPKAARSGGAKPR
jgi:RNA polymerase sigma factor (sigma-70 family)